MLDDNEKSCATNKLNCDAGANDKFENFSDDDKYSVQIEKKKNSRRKRKFENISAADTLVSLSYEDARRIMKTDPSSSMVKVMDRKHLALGCHQCGHGSKAIYSILRRSLGVFRKELGGVPLAIGKIKVLHNANIFEHYECLHLDIDVPTIVFRPQINHDYNCTVTSVNERFITASLFGCVAFVVPTKNVTVHPKIGSIVRIKYVCTHFRNAVYQLRGRLSDLGGKTAKRKRLDTEDGQSSLTVS
ncbi:hypothetical protein AB6A40_010797 [Gnathostoma spinigerum]|uniref:Uncharacterized protein n=1 Tax=Gnathostoma spinigerum TaxID=75299 RepID=A0ABD6F2F2_9BILA